ncbi:M48 family metallopeptidase [Pseudomonas chlororaphis]|uniref:M48 family metallopeptidase n=1 Tax=Pseudomonas chlororaphis TaxID=587753 RepID=UPI001CF5D767|nr:M48 family metalloprotease [Pseudomonas chlororaphis]UCR85355.1 M48 family metalloprotease [Pseudomonas chlororaphis]
MNFFEHQARAKRRTGTLVLLMILAVLCLVTVTSLALNLLWLQFLKEMKQSPSFDWRLTAMIAAVVFLVVIGSSMGKHSELKAGGKVVAKRLGGRLINLHPDGLEEQRLLNVVEEMALASGTPVPQVYVLPDAGINAFAAGFTPQEAVIGVTRGAIMVLNREELQAVIAHEFSHIYNGDMRLNTRLVAIVHGILVIGLTGEAMANGVNQAGRLAQNRVGGLAMWSGLALILLGSVGTFFGNMIKGAISREREFLADASAVQFTRNPAGLVGALKKIGGYAASSKLDSAFSSEYSHLYFSEGATLSVYGQSATHPPLSTRIRRLEPGWDGRLPTIEAIELPAEPARSGLDSSGVFSRQSQATSALVFDLNAIKQSIASIGSPNAQHLLAAQAALVSLDPALQRSAHSTTGAQALVYGLLLSANESMRRRQLAQLDANSPTEVFGCLQALQKQLAALDPNLRLPLLDLSIPALQQLDKKACKPFMDNLRQLIDADDQVELLEWTLLRIVQRNVEGLPAPEYKWGLFQRSEELAVLLGALASAGQKTAQQAQLALAHAWTGLPFARPQPAEVDLEHLDAALVRLRQLMPEERPMLLQAMARCVCYDGQVTVAEAELMRAVADVLDCPMPPLLSPAAPQPASTQTSVESPQTATL